jgi:hypothetical protein
MGEWRYSSTFLDLGTRWRRMVTFTHMPLYPPGKCPRYPLDRSLGGPQNRFGRCGEKKNILHCRESNLGRSARRYTDLMTTEKLIRKDVEESIMA